MVTIQILTGFNCFDLFLKKKYRVIFKRDSMDASQLSRSTKAPHQQTKQAYPTTISLKPVTVKALTLTFLAHINHLGFFDRVS